jgi:hypothetical protein
MKDETKLNDTVWDDQLVHPRQRSTSRTEISEPSIVYEKRTNREFRSNAQIGDYDMDNIILDLGHDVNVLPK